MDKLLLLFKGKTIYFGDSGKKSVDYFESIGFNCDINTNPSDFFMYIMQSKNEGLETYLTNEFEKSGGIKFDSTKNEAIKVDLESFPGLGAQLSALFKRSIKMTIRNPV